MNELSISIDGQLHIRKLCERYLPEKELALLEWIRFARLRHARTISIHIKNDETVIHDDGDAISPIIWSAMETLLRSSDSDEIERSIELLKPVRGIGILAPLAIGAEGFTIVSPHTEGNSILSHGNGGPQKPVLRIENKVALIIGQRSTDFNRESELLNQQLPLVDAAITLNNQTIAYRRHPRDTFLSLKIYQDDIPVGTVSLPRSSNHSSIELCHGDIPWRTVHYPPKQGRVFWSRLDSVRNEEELGPLLEQMERANLRLLEYLRDHFDQMPKSLLPRVEELLLEWSKPQAPQFPIMNLPLFRMSGKKGRVSLAQIFSEKERSGSLSAIICDQDNQKQPDGNGTLLLSRKQADFLARSAEIQLNFTGSPQSFLMPFVPKYKVLFLNLILRLDRFVSSFFSNRGKTEPFRHIEQILLAYLGNDPEWNLISDISSYQVVMLKYGGIWPSHAHTEKKLITLHSDHPVTRALLRAIPEKSSSYLFVRSLIPPEIM